MIVSKIPFQSHHVNSKITCIEVFAQFESQFYRFCLTFNSISTLSFLSMCNKYHFICLFNFRTSLIQNGAADICGRYSKPVVLHFIYIRKKKCIFFYSKVTLKYVLLYHFMSYCYKHRRHVLFSPYNRNAQMLIHVSSQLRTSDTITSVFDLDLFSAHKARKFKQSGQNINMFSNPRIFSGTI